MGFRYLQSVKGHAVRRFGSTSYIGCTRTPERFVWHEEPTAIPEAEFDLYARDYLIELRAQRLVELSETAARELIEKGERERDQADRAALKEMRDKEAAEIAKARETEADAQRAIESGPFAAAPAPALDSGSDDGATRQGKKRKP